MSPSIAPATEIGAAELAAFAAPLQREPACVIAYLGEDDVAVAAEIEAIPDWRDHSVVALLEGRLVGMLVGEVDSDMGRVWWWGPFATEAWHETADALYQAAGDRLASHICQEECAGAAANTRLEIFCERHGFVAGSASVQLLCTPPLVRDAPRVGPLCDAQRAAVATLHDAAFPGAHQTGARVVAATGTDNVVVAARAGDDTVGYAVGQVQPDGAGYVDFISVDPRYRRRGYACELIAGLSAALVAGGARRLQLTVRETNTAARALYARLGFVEEQILRPYRKGFELT